MNLIDPNGKDWVYRVVDGVHEIYYDRSVRSQDDVNIKYGSDGGVTHLATGATATISQNGEVASQYTFFNDPNDTNQYGAVLDQSGNLMADNQIISGSCYNIFGTSDNSVNAETLHKNRFGTSYIGEHNPKDYTGNWSYLFQPQSAAEWAAYYHDLGYDLENAAGGNDAFLNPNVYPADAALALRSLKAVFANNSIADRGRAAVVGSLFGLISIYKRPLYEFNSVVTKPGRRAGGQAILSNMRPTISY